MIVPANGWMSAAEAVRLVGATPVFVDSDPDTYAMDVSQVEARWTHHTRAVVIVHLYGRATDPAALVALARARGGLVIEDCAQAHGAVVNRQRAGSLGHVAAFSFYPTKNLGALGDGGAMLTQDAALAATLRQVANHGQVARDQAVRLGRNSRMDALQAAVLSLKLPYLDAWNQRRQQLARHYEERLAGLPLTLPARPDNDQHVHHLYVVRVRHRDAVQRFLANEGVATQIHYPTPVPDLIPFRHLIPPPTGFPVARRQAAELLSLPLHPTLSWSAVDYVCDVLRRAVASIR